MVLFTLKKTRMGTASPTSLSMPKNKATRIYKQVGMSPSPKQQKTAQGPLMDPCLGHQEKGHLFGWSFSLGSIQGGFPKKQRGKTGNQLLRTKIKEATWGLVLHT